MLKCILAGLIIAVVMASGVAVAGPFEDANAAYVRGDCATALKIWRPLADRGNAVAEAQLGKMYRDGKGGPAGLCRGTELVPKVHRSGQRTRSVVLG